MVGRVPAVYPQSAFVATLALVAFHRMNNLRVVKLAREFDSPRLHHFPFGLTSLE